MPTEISYVDETWNPARGCSPASPGCANCYAAAVSRRWWPHLVDGRGNWTGEVELLPEALEKPLRWRALRTCLCCDWESGRSWCPVHVAEGARTTRNRTVLTPSMGDMFHDDVPDEYIAAWFGVMAQARRHTFLVLTKRIQRALTWLEWVRSKPGNAVTEWMRCTGHAYLVGMNEWGTSDPRTDRLGKAAPQDPDAPPWPLPNVIIGTTVENQPRADERLPHLRRISDLGWLTWASHEPALGPVDFVPFRKMVGDPMVPWFVATGAETGPGARPCDEGWIRAVVQQCRTAGVKCHVKALTGHRDMSTWPEDLRVREMPRG